MGNNLGKKQCVDSCQKNLEELFNAISAKKGCVRRDDLRRTWFNLIDKDLYNKIENYLFFENHNELTCQTFKKFYLDICKGDLEQKVEILQFLLDGKNEINGQKLLQFLTSILSSILIIQESKSPKRYSTWNNKANNIKGSAQSLEIYACYFLNQTQKTPNSTFTREELKVVLTEIDFFLHMILCRLYDTEEKHFYTSLLPKWRYAALHSERKLEEISVLDICKIIFLNFQLPVDFQQEWRILFSTSVQGESFSKLSGEIINKGPTLIIIKDKNDHIFGGFAPSNWNLGPNFFGDSRSFLFSLQPRMNVFSSTNFNENYQYMNIGQQTMPNGLGMGGRLEYFGMWLNAEFGKGYCSESCTTYRSYKMMSSTKEFEISHLEVWGVGPPPPSAAELGERSVLDGNLEAKAILEMAGKTAYSDGLREDIDI